MTKEELDQLIKEKVAAARKEAVDEMQEKYDEQVEQLKKDTEERLLTMSTDTENKLKKFEEDSLKKQNPSGFVNFADFAQNVAKTAKAGGSPTEKLKSYIEKDAGSGMSAGVADEGAFLIPEEFSSTLLKVAIEKSDIMGRAMKIPMSSNTIHLPYIMGFDRSGGTVHGGIQWKWLNELAQKSETTPEFGRITMNLNKVAGLAYASDEIIEDSPVSIAPLLNSMFTDGLSWQLDNVFINGTGAGQPLGVVNAGCLVDVAIETGQAADTVLYENIVKMYARMWRKANAVWFANDDVFKQLAVMSLAVGTGGAPVYLPAGGASGKPYDTLMGKPLVFSEHMQTLGDAHDIGLFDWSQYLIGQKAGAGVDAATSIHLKFDYDQTAFRFVFRVDGQPWWPEPLTPRYSSDTLSPFVSLAERA